MADKTHDPRINLRYRHKLLVPFGYGTAQKSLYDLTTWLLVHYHPEYIRRLINWLDAQDGEIGVGGGWRAGGAQPDKPGFAEEGRSFHQDQAFNDGFTGAAAVDLVARNGSNVHRSPRWDEVPAQGSAEAKKWGVHCNVGAPGQVGSEPWHIQPIEIDGWQSWWNAGRPSPRADYPIPGGQASPEPPPVPIPDPPEDDDMNAAKTYICRSDSGRYKGQLLLSLGGVCFRPVAKGADENGIKARMDSGRTRFFDMQSETLVERFQDIKPYGGAWVVQMGADLS